MDNHLVSELAAAIDAELLFTNWRLYALTLAVLLLSKAIDAYFVRYWAKRADVKAAGADLQEVIRQLKATTAAAEAVRAQISKADWLDKEWRSIRRVKLEELLSSADGMLETLGYKAADDPESPTNNDANKLKMLCALYFPELRQDVTDLYVAFKECRIHFLESQSDFANALTEGVADEVLEEYRLRQRQLYSVFVQAGFTLEKAAAELMQEISLHKEEQ